MPLPCSPRRVYKLLRHTCQNMRQGIQHQSKQLKLKGIQHKHWIRSGASHGAPASLDLCGQATCSGKNVSQTALANFAPESTASLGIVTGFPTTMRIGSGNFMKGLSRSTFPRQQSVTGAKSMHHDHHQLLQLLHHHHHHHVETRPHLQ